MVAVGKPGFPTPLWVGERRGVEVPQPSPGGGVWQP